MKPITSAAESAKLLERLLNGEGAMLRALRISGPASASVTLSVQDKQRGYDWIDMTFEMHGISDARFVDDAKLEFIDTDKGITALFEDGLWGWGVGRYGSLSSLKDAPLFCIGTSLKYEEAPFSG